MEVHAGSKKRGVKLGIGREYMMNGGQTKVGKGLRISKNPLGVTKSNSQVVLRSGFDRIAENFEVAIGTIFTSTFEVGVRDLIGIF